MNNLGVYIGDNVDSNDNEWKATLMVLHLDRDLKASRSRYLSHIINLATKAFIFSKNVDTFEAMVDRVNDCGPLGVTGDESCLDRMEVEGSA